MLSDCPNYCPDEFSELLDCEEVLLPVVYSAKSSLLAVV